MHVAQSIFYKIISIPIRAASNVGTAIVKPFFIKFLKKVIYNIKKGVAGEALCNVISEAQKARQDGTQVLVARMNKNKKFQKEQLINEGYENFEEFYKEDLAMYFPSFDKLYRSKIIESITMAFDFVYSF